MSSSNAKDLSKALFSFVFTVFIFLMNLFIFWGGFYYTPNCPTYYNVVPVYLEGSPILSKTCQNSHKVFNKEFNNVHAIVSIFCDITNKSSHIYSIILIGLSLKRDL